MAVALASESQTIFDILNLWSKGPQGPSNESHRFYMCTPRLETTAEKPSYRCTPTEPPFPLKKTKDERKVPIKALWPQALEPLFLAYELGAPAMIEEKVR